MLLRFLVLLLCLIMQACDHLENSSGDWMDRAVSREFRRYEKTGITKDLLEQTWLSCKKYKEFHRYQIIGSKVYGPESRVRVFLEEIVQRFSVPDVDFIFYYEDRVKKSFFDRSAHKKSAPIFVSARDISLDQVVLFMDWNYNIQDLSSGWNFLIQKINQVAMDSPWDKKIEKLIWRGTPWDGKHFGMYTFENWKTIPRGQLVACSLKFPDLIDAAFTEYPKQCLEKGLSNCVKEMGPLRFVPWDETIAHKYQILVDGVTCSFPATQWKLLSGCLCFKQESRDIQHFYEELIPWKHYIPVKKDMSDLKEKILWAKSHDLQAQEIAKNSREFALSHLMPEHILLYGYKVLLKYASLQKFTPEISHQELKD